MIFREVRIGPQLDKAGAQRWKFGETLAAAARESRVARDTANKNSAIGSKGEHVNGAKAGNDRAFPEEAAIDAAGDRTAGKSCKQSGLVDDGNVDNIGRSERWACTERVEDTLLGNMAGSTTISPSGRHG